MVHEDLASLWNTHREADAIFIDMPIGLLDSGPGERFCEPLARRMLGFRRSSVFPVPCRHAVYATSDVDAIAANSRYLGRGLSLQTLAIRAKIRLLRNDAQARAVFREIHPELLFWAMNGGKPMTHRKKRREGRMERQTLLAEVAGVSVVDDVLAQGRAYLRRDLGEDDTLDALAAAVAAGHPDELFSVPEAPARDSCGLPMQMVYWPSVQTY
jgi:predicted RNase H-like nuclease